MSQPDPWLHTCNHAAVLKLALHQRAAAERSAKHCVSSAAPGSMTGRYPVGNTGRVDAGLMTPLPIPEDPAAALAVK